MENKSIKTVRQIIAEYLDEQKGRLAPSTLRSYEDALGWLTCCMSNYGHTFLAEEKLNLFEKKQEQGVEFEDFFGCEAFADGIFYEFLGYFLPRKTCVGKENLKKICGITLNFYKWLVENGYIDDENVKETVKDLRDDCKESWIEYEEMVSHCEE